MKLLVRCRLRRFVLERCEHWKIPRQRVPRAFIEGIASDLEKQVDARIFAELNKADPLPKPPKPRKAKIYKRALKNQPTLF